MDVSIAWHVTTHSPWHCACIDSAGSMPEKKFGIPIENQPERHYVVGFFNNFNLSKDPLGRGED